MKKSIPPDLHALVLQLAGEGKTSEEIAEILFRQHRCESTSRGVRRLLEHYRTERADVSKGIIRDRLQKQLTADLIALESLHGRARAKEQAANRAAMKLRKLGAERDDPDALKSALKYDLLALKAMDRELRAINLVLHYSGAGEPDQPPLLTQDKRTALMQRLERLIRAETTPEPTPGPKDEPPVH